MSATPDFFFDASLPVFVRKVAEQFGPEILNRGTVVRDTSGRLRFLSAEESPSDDDRSIIEAKLSEGLGAYARPDQVIAFCDEPGVLRLLTDTAAFPMLEDSLRFRLLDRRIVGSGWVDRPNEEVVWPPRIVFTSLKGGVGRSTALAVTASDLSRRNSNVLAIDLDLEAPGLGDMLLDDERAPRYGTVDYLVENGLGGISDHSLQDFIGASALTTAGGGRVDVLPALGKEALARPSNTLPKLARAMIEDIDTQIAEMIKRFTERDAYDVVLIDSRAGLSELAAPTIIGLGANVLLFGTAQRQTINGYVALFEGLKMLAERDRAVGGRAEWRLLFKAVHAKATLDESSAAWYRDSLYDLFAEKLYDAEDDEQASVDSVNFDIDDKEAPHWPLMIPFTQNLIDFDPVRTPGQLTVAIYEQTYRSFLDGIDAIIASNDIPREESGQE
jgi:MinD-like ATPase involved in chromosome partitioning or flagellar assembly